MNTSIANPVNDVKECIACKTTFIRQSDMIRHIKRFHPKNAENLIAKMESSTLLFKCDQCNKRFSNKKNLNFHRKSHCGSDTGVKVRKKCPLCDHVAPFKKDFYQHCEVAHNIVMDIEKMDFTSMDDFLNWKAEIEGAMNCKFVKEYGSTVKIKNYVCSQSEFFNNESEMTSYHEKKINGFCPAGFRVMNEENGKCNIYFAKTHLCNQNKSLFLHTKNEELNENLEHEHYSEDLKNRSETNIDKVPQSDSSNGKKSKNAKKKEFLLRKKEMMKSVFTILDTISSNAELEAVQELINPIKPILGILQSQSKE